MADAEQDKIMLIAKKIPFSQYSIPFLQGMLNRVSVSYHKYGNASENFPDKMKGIDNAIHRIEKYRETKNIEYLIDAGNFIMFEFMYPSVPGFHWDSLGESPGLTMIDGTVIRLEDNE